MGIDLEGPASLLDALSVELLASRQLSLDKGAEEPFPSWTWPHAAVGEGSLVGAWLGVDKGEKPCSSSLAKPEALLPALRGARGRGWTPAHENSLGVSPSYTPGPLSVNGLGSLMPPWWELWTQPWGNGWCTAQPCPPGILTH